MLITGAAVHPGVQPNDTEVHVSLLGDMSAHIRLRNTASIP